jgi:fluoride ion exporter CrcB/FEX
MKPTLKTTALVFAGGALGSVLRYVLTGLTNWIVADRNIFQISFGWFAKSNFEEFDPTKSVVTSLAGIIALTLVNSLGTASLGWFNGDQRFASESRKAFWAVGFAGGFTTMSGLFVWLIFTSQFTAEITAFALAVSVLLSGLSYVFAVKIAKKWRG